MFLPRGTEVWKDLNTVFLDIDNLLLFLKHQEFTGHIRFVFPDEEGGILLEEGDMVGGITESKNERRGGPVVAKEILRSLRNKPPARLTVTRLSLETVGFLEELFRLPYRPLHRNLSSQFSNLGRFVKTAKRTGFTGYIEITFSGENVEGVLFFKNGKIEAAFTEEIQVGPGKELETELKSVSSKIVEEAQKAGVRYDIYVQQ
jgi:hypothetical protein